MKSIVGKARNFWYKVRASAAHSAPFLIGLILGFEQSWHLLKLILVLIKSGPIKTNMKLIGVTGTDGKTTTTNFIYSILKASGKRVGMISTIGAVFDGNELDTGAHTTTPTYAQVKNYLAQMEKNNIEYAVLEVTAHGLFQYRLYGLKFIASALTNITREHLDYFFDMRHYARAKQLLFRNSDISVINADDPESLKISVDGKKVTYAISGSASYKAESVSASSESTSFKLKHGSEEVLITINLPGLYNVSNALAAAALCHELGVDLTSISKGLAVLKYVSGRSEQMLLQQASFKVIVDFAHTPNALERITASCKQKYPESKIRLVFGCAGLRDKEKRPLMGEIAGRLADHVYVTAEDPRTEDVHEICKQITGGMSSEALNKTKVIVDRRSAIKEAMANAGPNDLVLITGKGHEKTMCFGEIEYPWSDQAAVLDVWKELQKKGN